MKDKPLKVAVRVERVIEKGFTIPVTNAGYVRYIDHMGDDDRVLEFARVCYDSHSKGEEADFKLLSYLHNNKHTSPFEAPKLTLNVKMPIFIMRQWVRHRMQNLNEVSARYTELPDDFFYPEEWRIQDKKNKQSSQVSNEQSFDYCDEILEASYRNSYDKYRKLLRQGVARELARLVLPVGIYTEIFTVFDLKNLLHFISLREHPHAQYEFQLYAKAIKEIMCKIWPKTMAIYETTKKEQAIKEQLFQEYTRKLKEENEEA